MTTLINPVQQVKKLNCWEFKKCGREPGGTKVHELGVCPAAQEGQFNEIFGGFNSGRACWVVAGTFCKGEVQGIFAQKFKNCSNCDFFKKVQQEESESFKPITVLMSYIDKTHEQRVDERTLELRKAKEALEIANGKLELLNRTLEQTNRVASMDMDMAARVQASFFPKDNPKSIFWDVAYTFQPLSGVSGDLYDFYSNKGEFTGVSLFDVSGHGIASGLITLLARSVIHHQFMLGIDKPLSQVIETVNHDLINEIDVIENYLTGILLRFTDNKVEYINAGHTDLLIKRARTGKVYKVEPKGKNFRGNFLGISILEDRYKTVVFSMAKEDLIFLYSDCLIESKNNDGEEYGLERIENSLSLISSQKSAQEILDKILDDFFHFVGSKALKDDMTAILVKRKNMTDFIPDTGL